ncbi:MAG TPA: cyclopropane-fatty-acyl-phospholipid synthase family protein [Candidatus Didemnitutus sp.]|nr:cyclopropane-fatty-acyl-phospholipid synthase family protein [Candidatus Didemnitutus sp.]
MSMLPSASTVVGPIHSPGVAERLVLGSFAESQLGRLRVELSDGSAREFGTARGPAREFAPGVADQAVIRVRRDAFFRKCLLHGDIGFAESYLDGDWDTPDLTAVIGWFVANVDTAPTLSGSHRARSFVLNLLRFVNRLGHLRRDNTRARAGRNIRDHYDLSNDFFALWLDPSLMYSSARWDRPDLTLAQAQAAKNEALCRLLRLTPDDHVLEIGTGWGGWSLQAARDHGCRVTTLTISERQAELARSRVAAAGLSDRIEVRLQDYRDVRESFDKIVSIEMLEAVGHRHLPAFAAACGRALKREGLLALQFITCPDHRYSQFRSGVDFIQKHIFPGSLLLSANRLNSLLARRGGFVLHRLEDLGRDYARTLRLWREEFNRRLDGVRALGFDDRFIRKWHYYLSYCEAAFALRNISVVQTLHTRPNNLAL